MMRNGAIYGIAVRLPGGRIFSRRMEWKTLCNARWLKIPFLRGFPILIESLVNGIQALNLSAAIVGETEIARPGHLAINLVLALLLGLTLFVGAPHLLAMLMLVLGWGGDVSTQSFHLWDGLYKCAIFIAYIWFISFIPEIRRVFEYHGAEHKVINAWENGIELEKGNACAMSRLHPRCGTTFLLFVICIAIIAQAMLIPLFFSLLPMESFWKRHIFSLCLKLILIIPISGCAYELIRFTDNLSTCWLVRLIQWPGLALQMLTTREPGQAQLEVAKMALWEAINTESAEPSTNA